MRMMASSAAMGAGLAACAPPPEAPLLVLVSIDGLRGDHLGRRDPGGHTISPSYEQICQGDTGHAEVVRLTFDADVISLQEILEIFFHTHNPTTLNRQGNDVGTQYRSGIYFDNAEHGEIACDMIRQMTQDKIFGAPITTEVKPLANYSTAEACHQDYFAKHPGAGYCAFVVGPKVEKFRKTFSRFLKG
jgi:peptide-methionine (S)-S-oxide reductase